MNMYQATPRQDGPPVHRLVLPIVLVCGLVLFLATWWTSLAPSSVPADHPDDARFSAEETLETLRFLLGDQSPHPMGSAANKQVRARILEVLEGAGIESLEQNTLACVSRSVAHCGFVENVFGVLPGETDETVVLMAHYDSVTNAPGAGDDGAGVATVLEVMRRLHQEQAARGTKYKNTVLAALTDGEEEGLFGAEAFFEQHPAAKNVRVLINIEGSGSGGPSNLLRASPGSGDLVALYRETAPHPMASSIATEIFKRMPNDTDFSVGIRAGVKGLDFAFAGERNHYHTPLDTIENLQPQTLQHHGDNVLPMMRRLVDYDLSSIGGEASYTTMLDTWVMWGQSMSLPLACLGTLLLLLSIAVMMRKVSVLQTLAGVLAALAVLLASIMACALCLFVAGKIAGRGARVAGHDLAVAAGTRGCGTRHHGVALSAGT